MWFNRNIDSVNACDLIEIAVRLGCYFYEITFNEAHKIHSQTGDFSESHEVYIMVLFFENVDKWRKRFKRKCLNICVRLIQCQEEHLIMQSSGHLMHLTPLCQNWFLSNISFGFFWLKSLYWGVVLLNFRAHWNSTYIGRVTMLIMFFGN